jgi:UDP-N-acetylglucosamine 2-epimerase (non-hydrolysing)
MLKVHLIVGARPNYMKMAPLYDEFAKYPDKFMPHLIHTGQHYDDSMSRLFFVDLKMPQPDIFLEVGSGSHGEQTARIMERYEKYLMEDKPDVVFVAGDVNSTMACAIDAAKLHYPVAHVEAGLRSYDRLMPEEINRLLTDQVADYLLIPSADAEANLLKEGIAKDKIHLVGNIMIDSLIRHIDLARKSYTLRELGLQQGRDIEKYCLVTLHRPSNVDEKAGFEAILNALSIISRKIKVVFPMHPRTQKSVRRFGLDKVIDAMPDLIVTEPLGYLDFLDLELNADFVITDSGGIQEETTFLQIPCLTLRENTERPITVSEGTNQLVKLDTEHIVKAAEDILNGIRKPGKIPKYWDGKTSERIVEIFCKL